MFHYMTDFLKGLVTNVPPQFQSLSFSALCPHKWPPRIASSGLLALCCWLNLSTAKQQQETVWWQKRKYEMIGRIVILKGIHVLFLRPWEYITLYSKKDRLIS